jgi:hypothetical protein
VTGILADANAIGHVEALVRAMQGESWADFWQELGLVLRHFEDVSLSAGASDREIWQRCQAEQLVLVTNNRNDDSPESLEATIRQFGTPDSLPVFTIANLRKLDSDRAYAERVVASFYDYLLRIDEVRGTGRLYLP